MRSGVYATVHVGVRMSVRPSVPSIDSSSGVHLRQVCAVAGSCGRRVTSYRSISAAGARAHRKCGLRHVESRGTRLNTDLRYLCLFVFLRCHRCCCGIEIFLIIICNKRALLSFLYQWRNYNFLTPRQTFATGDDVNDDVTV